MKIIKNSILQILQNLYVDAVEFNLEKLDDLCNSSLEDGFCWQTIVNNDNQ